MTYCLFFGGHWEPLPPPLPTSRCYVIQMMTSNPWHSFHCVAPRGGCRCCRLMFFIFSSLHPPPGSRLSFFCSFKHVHILKLYDSCQRAAVTARTGSKNISLFPLPLAGCPVGHHFLSSPLVTWRDVQHLLVKTSRSAHLKAGDWKTNAAGHRGGMASIWAFLVPEASGRVPLTRAEKFV